MSLLRSGFDSLAGKNFFLDRFDCFYFLFVLVSNIPRSMKILNSPVDTQVLLKHTH